MELPHKRIHEGLAGPVWPERGTVFHKTHTVGSKSYPQLWRQRSRSEGWSAPWPGDTEGEPVYHINSQGWRCGTTDAVSGTVWFVGCSETYGQAVPQGQTMVEHYQRLTGVSALNLGWPGGSNSWNTQLTINRLLGDGAPDWVFFQWTMPERFWVYDQPGAVNHWIPNYDHVHVDRCVLDHHTVLCEIEARQWQAYTSLCAAFPGRITHWTGFGSERIGLGLPNNTIEEWGMPLRIPEDLAQDGAHSNSGRHLRWAERAAQIWPA